MSRFEQALKLIESNINQAYFAGPQSDELIGKAESALGLRFPTTYREFLRRFGAGDIAGVEVYGITGGNFESGSVPNGIWLTLNERKLSSVIHSLIVIGDTGDGNYYVIDTSRENANGDCPVIEWAPGESNVTGQSERVADDFGCYLFERLREAL